jgi:Putative zinc-finger
MKSTSIPPNSEKTPHEDIRLLLPWYATRNLSPGETAMIEEHLKTCAPCSSELSNCQSLAQNPPQASQTWQPSSAHFAGIMQRIEAAEGKAPAKSASQSLPQKPGLFKRMAQTLTDIPRAVQWTLALETAACFGLLLVLAVSANTPPLFNPGFETLSDQEKPLTTQGRSLRLVFADELTAQELAALLKQVGGQIRQGPSAVGAYVVEVPATDPAKALGILRANPKVRLAQPIAGESQP